MDDVSVLVIVVGVKLLVEGCDFFLLFVYYQEKIYVVGCIFGGFFKCEGCFFEKEILILCLIDCLICLLFFEGFMNEVQVVCIVVFINKKFDLDIVVMIGIFVVLVIFGILFVGLIGVVCVGFYLEIGYIFNFIYE